MLQERVIGEVLEARGVIGHDVGLPWEEGSEVAVSVRALMVTGEAAHSRRGSWAGGDSALVHPGDGWGVVGAVLEGGVADVMVAAHDVHLSKQGGVF